MPKQTTKQRSANTLSTSIYLTPAQQQTVLNLVDFDLSRFPFNDIRNRLLVLDLAYFMERDQNPNISPNAPQIVTAMYQDCELPVLQPNIDAAHAYLAGVFTSGTPIFAVASTNPAEEKQEAARQLEAVVHENSTTTQWKRNINLFLLDTLKYNFGAVDVDWKTQKTFIPTTDLNQNLLQGNVDENWRSGNEIKHLDMYNCFWDMHTKPASINAEGDFFGTIYRKTFVQMWKIVEDLKAAGEAVMNVQGESFWKSSPRQLRYFVPPIISTQTVNAFTDWNSWFGNMGTSMMGNVKSDFELMVVHHRVIPRMLGITNVPDSNSVQVWTFMIANGLVIHAKRRTNAHNLLPSILAQGKEDGLGVQTKGTGELQLPFQRNSSTMWRARIASLARSLSDRAIYDPTRISKKDINSPLPIAKIELRPAGYGKPIDQAYYAIPFQDITGQILSNEVNTVNRHASSAAGINAAQRGEFTKGNRTQGEFNTIMDNSDAKQQVQAIGLEDQAFMPMKRIVLTNILQYQQVGEYLDPATQQPIEINPVTLRQATLEFGMADGLENKDKLLSVDATLQSIQVMAGVEGANQEYDLIGATAYAMGAKGSKIRFFKRQTPFTPMAPIQTSVPEGNTPQGSPA